MIQSYIHSSYMLKIKKLTNKKLVENFPRDPYANVVIFTKTQELHLQLAHLAIDSQYFHNVVPDAKEIRLDLPNLSQQHLIRVIRALYGGQLEATSIKDLIELYKILEYLQIDDYKANIIDQIMTRPQLKDQLEMLQFSFRNGILTETFINHHLQNKLKLLQDNRNYLQLNKIHVDTMNTLLLQFQEMYKEQSHQTINNVLQNYLNRNNFSPAQYFTPEIQVLKRIWEKYHHTIQYVQKIKSSDKMVKNSICLPTNSWINSNQLKKSMPTALSYDPKSLKIKQLQQQLQIKDQQIKRLRMQNIRLQELLKNADINTQSQMSNSQTYDFRNLKGMLFTPSANNSNSKNIHKIVEDDEELNDQFNNKANLSGQYQTSLLDKEVEQQKRVLKTKQPKKLVNLKNSRNPIFESSYRH